MSRVNYVREMEAFGDYAEANSLGSSERLVWLALFRAVNARAYGDEWPDGFVEIRNRELVAASGLSRMTVSRAREKLARRGLIDFIMGDGESASGYKLHFFSVHGAPQPVDKSADGCPQAVDKCENPAHVEQGGAQIVQGGAHAVQGGAQSEQGDAQGEQGKDVSTPYESTVNPSINPYINHEEDDIYNNNTTDARAKAGIVEAIGDGYREAIGRTPTKGEVSEILEVAVWNSAGPDLVREAVKRGSAASYPAKYAVTCLMQWGDVGLHTAEELDIYEQYKRLTEIARADIAERGRERLQTYLKELRLKYRTVAI
jgi:hypothetical protein